MQILMLSSTFPYPPSRGGTEIRTFNLLQYLQQRHEVILLTQRPPQVEDGEVAALRQAVSELHLFPLPADPPRGRGLRSLASKAARFSHALRKATPPNVLHRYSPALQAWVDAAVQAGRVQAITCEHSVNEIYVRPEFRQRLKTVVNVHSSLYGWVSNHLAMGASPQPLRDRLYLNLLLARYETRYCAKFTDIVVTTEDDRRQLRQFDPGATLHVIPNGVDLALFPYRDRDPGGYNLVFVGDMSASHNIDAARFFALEVLPQVQARYPEATFTIVGGRPTAAIQALGDRPGITVTGRVPSTTAYLHAAAVAVVPLRTGFGIKNKTLEAMAAGVPVVASDRGLEGLAVDEPGQPLRALRANDIEAYVTAIGRLFEAPTLRATLAAAGRALIEAEYTWEQAGARYEAVLTTRLEADDPTQ